MGSSLAALALLGSGGPAWAQHIDDYLNPAVPGFNVDPGVTVLSRLRPEYEYPGLKLGTFMLHSELAESAGYETNVTATKPAQGSPFIETAGTLSALSDWSTGTYGAVVTIDNNVYSAQPRQDYTDWTATTGGTHDFGEDTLYVGYTHLNLYQTPSGLGVPQLDSPIAYRVDTVRLNYKAVFGRTTLTPGIEVTNYSYDNGTVQGQPYTQAFRDRVVTAPNLIATYQLDPLRSLVFVARYAYANYYKPQPCAGSQDFNDIGFLAGINYDPGGLIRLRLLVGYETRLFTSPLYQTISAPIVEGSAVWTPTGLTTVTATLSRYIQDSSSENSGGYVQTSFRLSVDHEYLPNVLFNASAAVSNDAYTQGAGAQSYVSVGAGITWLINRHMRLEARYDFSSRQSPSSAVSTGGLTNAQIYGGSYNDNRFLLQFKIGL